MARFAVRRGTFGPQETVILEDTVGGARAVFVGLAATPLSWHVPWKGQLFDVTNGFATPEELASTRGSRAFILAPFSNRINEGRYEFGGLVHDLGIEDPRNRIIMHGFLKRIVCEATAERADDASAAVTFTTSAIRTGAFRGYPFDVDVAVTYTMTARRLDVAIVGRNVGRTDAPFGCGWHPYFKTPAAGVNGLRLVVPARTKIATDERLLPLPGDAAFVPLEKAPEFDFRPGSPRGNVVGTQVIDAAYGDLQSDADGWVRTHVEDPAGGMRITVLQERGLVHVFTGDPLPHRPRGSIALEPVEFMTNAFNRPECRAGITLRPGAERRFRFGVEVSA